MLILYLQTTSMINMVDMSVCLALVCMFFITTCKSYGCDDYCTSENFDLSICETCKPECADYCTDTFWEGPECTGCRKRSLLPLMGARDMNALSKTMNGKGSDLLRMWTGKENDLPDITNGKLGDLVRMWTGNDKSNAMNGKGNDFLRMWTGKGIKMLRMWNRNLTNTLLMKKAGMNDNSRMKAGEKRSVNI